MARCAHALRLQHLLPPRSLIEAQVRAASDVYFVHQIPRHTAHPCCGTAGPSRPLQTGADGVFPCAQEKWGNASALGKTVVTQPDHSATLHSAHNVLGTREQEAEWELCLGLHGRGGRGRGQGEARAQGDHRLSTACAQSAHLLWGHFEPQLRRAAHPAPGAKTAVACISWQPVCPARQGGRQCAQPYMQVGCRC